VATEASHDNSARIEYPALLAAYTQIPVEIRIAKRSLWNSRSGSAWKAISRPSSAEMAIRREQLLETHQEPCKI
jgi:hypothetical protein